MVSIGLAVYDIMVVLISYFAALWLRFDCTASAIPKEYIEAYRHYILIYAGICLAIFYHLRLYHSLWKFASYKELTQVVIGTIFTFIVNVVGTCVFFRRMPVSYYLVGTILQFFLVLGVRFSYRFVSLERSRRKAARAEAKATRVMLIGAGTAGQLLLRDIQKDEQMKERVCCIIDDNSNKWHRMLDGIPVVGGRDDIIKYAKQMEIEKIYVAIPSASAKDKRDILDICKETPCELKNMPELFQIVDGEISVNVMKDVSVEDLLGREPIKVDLQEIYESIEGKTILVTGGGGSIGSELCWQIADHNPKKLIIVDAYENNAYDIQQKLKHSHKDLDFDVIIGSVRDSSKMQEIFAAYRPQIVYHAAAHKHVPLMEDSPCEAIKNNVFGTYNTAYAACCHGCERFVLISTDKAVNPTNIMGASKRLCEMVIQTFDEGVKLGEVDRFPRLSAHRKDDPQEDEKIPADCKTEFVAVRFGNVLGSNGSVIPLFKKQIEMGGPVTVTHPEITRYFMTIPEAVSLVLQAGAYAEGGEIFVLDMGEPVKIDTLARNLIKLSGYKPDEDIKIVYSGLRPGEKLYEEKLMAEEGLKKTRNKLIYIGKPLTFDKKNFLADLRSLQEAAYENSSEIKEMVAKMVGTYHY